MQSRRNINIEFLRFLSILGVILIHMSMDLYYYQNLMYNNTALWLVGEGYYAISRFCVPVFFICSAYLAFNGKYNGSWVKRTMRLLIPYIAWSIIYYVYYGGSSFSELVKNTIFGTTAFHLWFLPCFLGFSLVLPFIVKAFDDYDSKAKFKHLVFILFLFSIFIPSITTLLNVFIGGFDYIKGINQFNLSIPSYFLYALSFPYLYQKINVTKGSIIYITLIIINLLIDVAISFKMGSTHEYWYSFTSPIVFISSFIFFNIFMSIDMSKFSEIIKKFLILVGEHSFGIYLVHWLVYLILQKYELTTHQLSFTTPLINTVTVFVVSFLFILIIRKIKPLRRLV